MPATKATKSAPAKAAKTAKTTKAAATTDAKYDGFTEDERDAMKQRAKELKAAARRPRGAKADEDTEAEVLAKIADMGAGDRAMAERIHAGIRAAVPALEPRLWYGMPAYAKDGKVLCFFQPATKFKTRYATFGFSDVAALDDGNFWPNAYALTKLTAADEKKLIALVKQAAA